MRRSVLRRLVRAWLALALWLVSLPSPGQTSPPPDVAAMKAEADRYMDNLDFGKAHALYEKAYARSNDPVFLYNSGRALQGLDRYPEALDKLEEFRRRATPELIARVPGLDELIASVRNNVATLSVRSSVAGARVLVTGKMVGVTPIERLRVNAGTTKIEVFKDGYRPVSMSVKLAGDKSRAIAVELVPTRQTGLLTVKSQVRGATVSVGDVELGVAPTQTELPAGAHKVVVMHPDYERFETTVVIHAGKSTRVSADLEPRATVLESWWFWTIAGVVVAGAVVTGVVLAVTLEREPDTGDIAPGQVSAPIRAAAQAPGIMAPPIRF